MLAALQDFKDSEDFLDVLDATDFAILEVDLKVFGFLFSRRCNRVARVESYSFLLGDSNDDDSLLSSSSSQDLQHSSKDQGCLLCLSLIRDTLIQTRAEHIMQAQIASSCRPQFWCAWRA